MPPFLCANAAHLWQNQCDSGSYTQLPRFPWRASQLETHHHWNLIGWYPQVRGRRYSAALLDSLALSPICGDVCSSWRHNTTQHVFLLLFLPQMHKPAHLSSFPAALSWTFNHHLGLWGRTCVTRLATNFCKRSAWKRTRQTVSVDRRQTN